MKNFQPDTTILGDKVLKIETNQHLTIRFFYSGSNDMAYCVSLDNNEFEASEENLNGIFVAIGKDFISLYQLMLEANEAYWPIFNEVEKLNQEAERHEKDMSAQHRYV